MIHITTAIHTPNILKAITDPNELLTYSNPILEEYVFSYSNIARIVLNTSYLLNRLSKSTQENLLNKYVEPTEQDEMQVFEEVQQLNFVYSMKDQEKEEIQLHVLKMANRGRFWGKGRYNLFDYSNRIQMDHFNPKEIKDPKDAYYKISN